MRLLCKKNRKYLPHFILIASLVLPLAILSSALSAQGRNGDGRGGRGDRGGRRDNGGGRGDRDPSLVADPE